AAPQAFTAFGQAAGAFLSTSFSNAAQSTADVGGIWQRIVTFIRKVLVQEFGPTVADFLQAFPAAPQLMSRFLPKGLRCAKDLAQAMLSGFGPFQFLPAWLLRTVADALTQSAANLVQSLLPIRLPPQAGGGASLASLIDRLLRALPRVFFAGFPGMPAFGGPMDAMMESGRKGLKCL